MSDSLRSRPDTDPDLVEDGPEIDAEHDAEQLLG